MIVPDQIRPGMGGAVVIEGAAAAVLRRDLPASSVDMVYIDPPFGTQQNWTGRAGSFSDKFAWDVEAERRFDLISVARPSLARLINVSPATPANRAYFVFMGEMLLELHRVLKPTGSIWLHCDDTSAAYLRLLLDGIFGPDLFLGVVIWKRTTSHSGQTAKRFGRVHDSVLVSGRTRAARWRLWRIGGLLVQGDPCEHLFVDGIIDNRMTATSKERVGYPTQKPLALMSVLIESGTLPGDVLLDATCGSGTSLVSAGQAGRRAIGIDQSPAAVAVARERLGQTADNPDRRRRSAAPIDTGPLFAGSAP